MTMTTLRPISPGMEDVMRSGTIGVLDHGFIRVVDYMGTDDCIVNAARVSYGRGTRRLSENIGLLNYLMRHHHTTPFEMCEIKIHVKMPIFVARQWIRHRTANVNEYSARYSILDNEFFLPTIPRIARQSKSNKQGSGESIDPDVARKILEALKQDAVRSFRTYNDMVESDVARELARINLPLSTYTQMYWKCDLKNLLNFIFLRDDAHAQEEIMVYAAYLGSVVAAWLPLTYRAFLEHWKESFVLSNSMRNVVRALIRGEPIETAKKKLTPREWEELVTGLRLD